MKIRSVTFTGSHDEIQQVKELAETHELNADLYLDGTEMSIWRKHKDQNLDQFLHSLNYRLGYINGINPNTQPELTESVDSENN